MGPDPMTVAVLGAGAMGAFVGGCLAASGVTVTLLDVNDAHLAAMRDGLRVITDDGERLAHPACARPDALAAPPDLLIVLTKQPSTRAALAAVRPMIGADTWVLTLQNGLGNQDIIEEVVPRDRLLIGVTSYPADLPGPGRVASHGQGQVRLMTADGVMRPITGRIAAMLRASGQDAVADPDVLVAIWSKVAFNAALNAICAAGRCRVGAVGRNPAARQLALDAAMEVVGVAHLAGHAVDPAYVRANVELAMDTHGDHRPSTLQDLLAGRPTEIGAINGAVVATAERLGGAAPLTKALLALVRLAEQEGVNAA